MTLSAVWSTSRRSGISPAASAPVSFSASSIACARVPMVRQTLPLIEDELACASHAIKRDELVGDELKKLIELELIPYGERRPVSIGCSSAGLVISRNKDFKISANALFRKQATGARDAFTNFLAFIPCSC